MSILNFTRKADQNAAEDGGFSPQMQSFLQGFSIEVMPRTAEKIDDFRAILPKGTRVYVAHIEGTPIEDMVATSKRITDEGFEVMPHLPARIIADHATFENWLTRYRDEAGATQALVLAGGPKTPHGDFDSSMQLLETGLFDKYGFNRLHVAGHPEGNVDIDPKGSTKLVDEAAAWKQAFSERSDAAMAMATQFAFEAGPVLEWARRLETAGINLPIHVGVAGPAKLQTLIKFAIACGVGPSLSVLQKRAKDLTKLLLPFEPTEVLQDFADAHAAGQSSLIESVHIFPLGGIKTSAAYCDKVLNPQPAA